VRYEHNLHIKSNAISVTGRGGLWCFEMMIPHCLDNQLTDGAEVISVRSGRTVLPRNMFSFVSLVFSFVRG
jgi:hypothetical protein